MKRLKTIYIIDNLWTAGAQIQLSRLVSGLLAKQAPVEIICLGIFKKKLVDDIGAQYIHFLKMDCIWTPSFWISYLRLIHILKNKRPMIVHTYLNTSNVFGAKAAKRAGVPIIITSRRDMGHFRTGRIGEMEKKSNIFTEKVTCVSEAVKKKVMEDENLDFDKAVVLYGGVDHKYFQSTINSTVNKKLKVGMIATTDREVKGHRDFLEAAKIILEKRQDIQFIIVGDGALRPSLEEFVKTNHLEKNIIFKGSQSDVRPSLEEIDIYIMPSHSEGFSNSVLEAMSMGKAVIAYGIEGNLEIIEHMTSGFFAKPRDTKDLAEKIIFLADHPEEITRVGQNARKRIEESFTINHMVDRYLQFYQRLVQKKSNRKSSQKNIGYIVSLFPCWSETFILNEIIALKQRGFEITIFSIRDDLEQHTQEKAKEFLSHTVYNNKLKMFRAFFKWLCVKPVVMFSLLTKVIFQPYKNFKLLTKNIWSILIGCFFANIVLKKELDHIHAHFATYPALVAMTIHKLIGIEYTFTTHAHDIFLDKILLKEKVDAAKYVVTISEYNRNYLSTYCGNNILWKIYVIHCGLNLNEWTYQPSLNGQSKINLLTVGRLTKMKGFDHFIRACALIKDKAEFTVNIIGDGHMRPELEKIIKENKLENQIILNGILDTSKVKELMLHSTAFVMPSVWDDIDGQDGIPLVLMEAMAIGKPVVASELSGIPELVEHKKSGLLVKPGDEKELANKILELIQSPTLREIFIKEGRAKIEREFDIEKSVERLSRLFE